MGRVEMSVFDGILNFLSWHRARVPYTCLKGCRDAIGHNSMVGANFWPSEPTKKRTRFLLMGHRAFVCQRSSEGSLHDNLNEWRVQNARHSQKPKKNKLQKRRQTHLLHLSRLSRKHTQTIAAKENFGGRYSYSQLQTFLEFFPITNQVTQCNSDISWGRMSTVTLAYRPSSGTALNGPFAHCALVEIIHLHDCLRGALNQLKDDVHELVKVSACLPDDATPTCRVDAGSVTDENSSSSESNSTSSTEKIFKIKEAQDSSNLIASRFHLIWSVFQAHSNAEDEIIWPALKAKVADMNKDVKNCGCASVLGQEEYEEDHATEEHMFKQIDVTIRRLNVSFRFYHASENDKTVALGIMKKPILMLKDQVDQLISHLVKHLLKEETQCLPMVQKHLSKEEIADLVGKIMGKRSAEVMTKILNLAVHSLPDEERYG